jgi:pyridoxamine 5'-phosphate oxidase
MAQPLREADLLPDPVAQFAAWFAAARDVGVALPETVVLATATTDAAPSARAVLLKGFDALGFVFFTGYGSRKGRELEANPQAALLFLWPGRQVRIEGTVERIPAAESDAYFGSRPFGSRVSASVSPQSEVVPDRETLERRAAVLRAEYAGREDELPRPDGWGGFRLDPVAFEFWQHGDDRLHDRFRYRRDGDGWAIERLAP